MSEKRADNFSDYFEEADQDLKRDKSKRAEAKGILAGKLDELAEELDQIHLRLEREGITETDAGLLKQRLESLEHVYTLAYDTYVKHHLAEESLKNTIEDLRLKKREVERLLAELDLKKTN